MAGKMQGEVRQKSLSHVMVRSVLWLVWGGMPLCWCLSLCAPLKIMAQSAAQKSDRKPVRPKQERPTKPSADSIRSATHIITPLSRNGPGLPERISLTDRTLPPFAQTVSGKGWTLYSRNANQINDFIRIGDETWLATRMGIKRIQHRTKMVRHYTPADGLPEENVFALVGDSQEVWCLNYTSYGGLYARRRSKSGYFLCRWSRTTDRWQVIREWDEYRSPVTGASTYGHRLAVTPQYVAIFSGPSHGDTFPAVLLYARQQKRWEEILWPKEMPMMPHVNTPPGIVFFHLEARFMWAGGYEGLWRYDLAERRWVRVLPEYRHIRCGYRDGDSFWLLAVRPDPKYPQGTGHLLRFHPATGDVQDIKIVSQEPENPYDTRQGFPHASILIPEGEDSVWMATPYYHDSTPELHRFDLKTGRLRLNYGQDPVRRWGQIETKALQQIPDRALPFLLMGGFPLPGTLVAQRLPGWICTPHGPAGEFSTMWDPSIHLTEWKEDTGAVWKPRPDAYLGKATEDGGLERIAAGKSETILLPDRTLSLHPSITKLTIRDGELRAQTTEAEYRSPLPEIRWTRYPLPIRPEREEKPPLPIAPEEAFGEQSPQGISSREEPQAVTAGLIWYLNKALFQKDGQPYLIAWDSKEERWRARFPLSWVGQHVSLLASGEEIYLLTGKNALLQSPDQAPAQEDGIYRLERSRDQWKSVAPLPPPLNNESNNRRYTLLTIRDGSIWVGGADSLTMWEWEIAAKRWRAHPTPKSTRRDLYDSLGTLHGDALYVGCQEGVWRFHFPTRAWEALPVPFPLRRLRMHKVVGEGQAIWAVLPFSIVARYESAAKQWTLWDETSGVPAIGRNGGPSLVVAGGEMRLAVGEDFYRLNRSKDRWEQISPLWPPKEGLWRRTEHISGDKDALWYAFSERPTASVGLPIPGDVTKMTLARYDFRREQWEALSLPKPFQNWNVILAEPDVLWITGGGSLWRLDKQTRKWTELTPPEGFGLPSMAFGGRLIRDGQSLWLISRESLLCYTPPKKAAGK
jgi:hypothetical protein